MIDCAKEEEEEEGGHASDFSERGIMVRTVHCCSCYKA